MNRVLLALTIMLGIVACDKSDSDDQAPSDAIKIERIEKANEDGILRYLKQFKYDNKGNLNYYESTAIGYGSWIYNFEYDDNGKLIEFDCVSENNEGDIKDSQNYNVLIENGNVVRVYNDNWSRIQQFTYNSNNQMVKDVTTYEGDVLETTFVWVENNIESVTDPIGNSGTVLYEFDSSNNVMATTGLPNAIIYLLQEDAESIGVNNSNLETTDYSQDKTVYTLNDNNYPIEAVCYYTHGSSTELDGIITYFYNEN